MKGKEFFLKHCVFICILFELPMAHAFLPVTSIVHIWLIKRKILSLKAKNFVDKKICIIDSAMTSEVFQGMYATEEFSPAYDLLGTYISLKSLDSIFHSTLFKKDVWSSY